MTNKNKKLFSFILVVIFYITIMFFIPGNSILIDVKALNEDYNLKIIGIDYGANTYGDTVLLESQGKYLLMDTGGKLNNQKEDKALYLISYLEKNNIYNFDIYISHYDQDHFYYIQYLLNNSKFNIGTVYLPDIKKTREQCANFESKYKDYLKSDCANYSMLLYNMCSVSYGRGETKATIHDLYSVEGNKNCVKFNKNMDLGNDYVGGYFKNYVLKKYPKVNFKYITKGDSINIGKARLDVIWHRIPDDVMGEYKKYDNLRFYREGNGAYSSRFANNSSLVAMVTAGNKKYFTAGDIQYEVEQDLIRESEKGNLNLKADVMKLSHHGLGTSNYYDFLKTVKPTYAFYQISTAVESGPGFTETDKISYISVSRSDDIWSGRIYNAQNYINTIFGTRYNGNVVFKLYNDDIKVEVERNYSKVKLYYNDTNGKRIKEKEFIVNKDANSMIDTSLNGYDLVKCDNEIVRKKYSNNTSYTCIYKSKVNNQVKQNNNTVSTSKKSNTNTSTNKVTEKNNTTNITNKATVSESNTTVSTNNSINKYVVVEDNNTNNNITTNKPSNEKVVESTNEVVEEVPEEKNVNNTNKITRLSKPVNTISKKENNTGIYIEIVVIILLIIVLFILRKKDTK